MRHLVFLALLGSALGCGSSTPEPSTPPSVAAVTPNASPGERVENPLYTTWAKFPVGARVVQRSVTETKGIDEKTVSTITYQLVEVTADRLVVEMQATTKRYDGVETVNPAERLVNHRWSTLPPGVTPAEKGKPAGVTESGEGTITVGGKEYSAKWYKGTGQNEGGKVFTQTWTSESVPGQLVKSVMTMPGTGKSTTIELVDVTIPKS